MLAAVLAAWPVRAVPVLDRSASISLARPVSISRAPAPTVTMTTAGTPIRATCHARRRRAACAGRAAARAAGAGARGVAHRSLPRAEKFVRLAERCGSGEPRRARRLRIGRRRQPHTAASVLPHRLTRELTRRFVVPARAMPRRAPRQRRRLPRVPQGRRCGGVAGGSRRGGPARGGAAGTGFLPATARVATGDVLASRRGRVAVQPRVRAVGLRRVRVAVQPRVAR